MSHSELGPVIVTGGSRGIGAASVRALVALGRPVVFSYARDADAADGLCAELTQAGGQVIAIKADVTDPTTPALLFDRCEAAFGTATGLFANAGITGPATKITDLSLADLTRVIDTNLIGCFLTVQEGARRMARGSIVLMSSRAAELGGGGEWVHYAASKGAINAMTKGLARELGPRDIRVNAVAPGLIDTEIHAAAGVGERLVQKRAEVPLGRIGTADEVADTVVWLLSERASYVTGTIVDIGGGR
ncbi:SDR family NAD(P)-dependent oxidoreductase [Roseicyclus sp.]|uniref:SDR family NAD(P)-dependent oxidoreductase n=1 Tax=Roseicyclus sp. TaxID=1914329 RepID=UPI003F6CAF3A